MVSFRFPAFFSFLPAFFVFFDFPTFPAPAIVEAHQSDSQEQEECGGDGAYKGTVDIEVVEIQMFDNPEYQGGDQCGKPECGGFHRNVFR